MYTLKSIARRGTMLGAAGALLVATVMPSTVVFADTLNPLTERSLLLSSSAPGYQYTDGSGNTDYAPPGSGPNGKQTGETFSFKVSTDSVAQSKPIKAFTLQYCTFAAGLCQAPGNNTGDARTTRDADTASTSDLNVNFETSPVAGTDYEIWMDGVNVSTGWTIATDNQEDDAFVGSLTGKKNFVTLTHATGISPNALDQIRIIFKASASNYITNPGDDEFFVKINTYDSDLTADHLPATSDHIIDGGVTVANVMTDSIHITTKVLETMSFSVGTQNEDLEEKTNPDKHGTCDPILQPNNNQLQLGNPSAEYSLETDTAWDVASFWRLSSNSSGGASVYYSGNTLANTVGDEIQEIGATETLSTPGTEQFGLAFTDPSAHSTSFAGEITGDPLRYRVPGLYTLNMQTNYDEGDGDINGTPTAKFAFLKSSSTTPVVIAQDSDDVVSCSTAKMRYVANIGADTPAGVYTTKINYLAAPQY